MFSATLCAQEQLLPNFQGAASCFGHKLLIFELWKVKICFSLTLAPIGQPKAVAIGDGMAEW